ncbi:hypothetical protein DPMN_121793 [Dreissena polymorpha]|uniref:Uncharacterized protein n=1 Tax=Dreissena polymorpha TaxID=45954 RepID=A0A9D4GR64_DREPO|nr:hypothetical protein DPMN_121793 [Dreissena polymorpha]
MHLTLQRDKNEALTSLQQKRNGELLREATTDSLSNLRQEGETLVPPNPEWPGMNGNAFEIDFS